MFGVHPGKFPAWNADATKLSTTVQLVDLHNFILDWVVPIVRAEKQRTGIAPPVIMKMDIEGAEFVVMPALMLKPSMTSNKRALLRSKKLFAIRFVDDLPNDIFAANAQETQRS